MLGGGLEILFFFIFNIESRYVSRVVTKVFLGHFGSVEDIFDDFGVPKRFLRQFGASED